MARTVNLEMRTVRREAFLDAGQRLIQTKGYEAMSIQDVLDALDTSRGAFYHYFESKLELLEAVVERFADVAMAAVSPILNDPTLPAMRKLEKVFAGIARYKAEQKDLILALIDVMDSDGNALFREKLRRMSASRLWPILTAVVRQGVEEGSFKTDMPDETARVIMVLMQGYQEIATELFVARQDGSLTYAAVKQTFSAYSQAFEGILGLPKGSAKLVDEATLRYWFG
jgi:AcrR family transcriptional regulator